MDTTAQHSGLTIGGLSVSGRAFLAPMAGITDLPFRRIARRFGAGLVVSEMIASGELLTGRAATKARAEVDDGCAAVQIAGREAEPMADCARAVEAMGARLIDINFGCPAKKVTSGLSGAALMRDLDHAVRLIDAVVAAVSVPVTVKMRLGWDETCQNAPEFARRAEQAGAQMVTVHGRTRSQFYKGRADWSAVAKVRDAAAGPLVVNGDICSEQDARRALLASGADAVMIGRGAQGAPWLPGQISAALDGKAPVPAPQGGALADLIGEHYEAMLDFYGRDLGLRVARKHLGWYLERLGGGAALRAELMRATSVAQVLAGIARIGDLPQQAAKAA